MLKRLFVSVSLPEEDEGPSFTVSHCPIMKFTPTDGDGADTFRRNKGGERMKGATVMESVKIKFDKGHQGGEIQLII